MLQVKGGLYSAGTGPGSVPLASSASAALQWMDWDEVLELGKQILRYAVGLADARGDGTERPEGPAAYRQHPPQGGTEELEGHNAESRLADQRFLFRCPCLEPGRQSGRRKQDMPAVPDTAARRMSRLVDALARDVLRRQLEHEHARPGVLYLVVEVRRILRELLAEQPRQA